MVPPCFGFSVGAAGADGVGVVSIGVPGVGAAGVGAAGAPVVGAGIAGAGADALGPQETRKSITTIRRLTGNKSGFLAISISSLLL